MDRNLQRFGVLSIAANLSFAMLKMLFGMVGHSYALVADGIESLADVFSSLLIWNGLRVAEKHPDEEHPYGHGKAESIASLLGGVALLFSAGLIAWNAAREIGTAQSAPAAFTIPALILIVAGKEGMHRFLKGRGEAHQSQALRVEAYHHRIDSFTSMAVLLGIIAAVLGGEHWAKADDIAALGVTGVIAFNAVKLLRPAVDDLMDRRIEGDREARILTLCEQVPGVEAIETLEIRRGGREYLVDVHLQVDPGLTVEEGHRIAHRLKDLLMGTSGLPVGRVMTHVEPFNPSRLSARIPERKGFGPAQPDRSEDRAQADPTPKN